jgi:GMC oxidoreductase
MSAFGVKRTFDGENHRRRRPRPLNSAEIILSAGAYNSPQLLMLSGIGKPADLKAVGINAQIDLPDADDSRTIQAWCSRTLLTHRRCSACSQKDTTSRRIAATVWPIYV